ncbi:unnamed protein product, partial [Mesorhabditis belari]|uniref:Uncharacterized protein n=1 Tax=Mesorhabditis belari TaxID=2138241 RepID=A0AAF3F4P7_9BILA
MSLLVVTLLASGFWATSAGSTLSPDNTYVCNTCHDPQYWDETTNGKLHFYAKPSQIFDMNKKNISQCPDLRTQTTGSRHRCLQACTYAIRAPSNYDPKNAPDTPKHVALSCGDLYKDFNGHEFKRDPCSLKKYPDGKTELMCRCTQTNCNRKIAQWAHRLTEEWNARNKSSSLPDDFLIFLFDRQDSLHTEVTSQSNSFTHPFTLSTSSASSSTPLPSTLITDLSITPDPLFMPVVMNSTETPAQGRLKKNQYLLMGVIFSLLAFCFILILCVALYRYRTASANYKLKEKRKKDNKKGKNNRSNGSTYAQLPFIDGEMPNQHPALSKEESDKRWMAMKETVVKVSEQRLLQRSTNAVDRLIANPVLPSPAVGFCAPWQGKVSPADSTHPSSPRSPREKAALSELDLIAAVEDEVRKELGAVANSYAIPEPDGEEEIVQLSVTDDRLNEPDVHSFTASQITEENDDYYNEGTSSLHKYNVN